MIPFRGIFPRRMYFSAAGLLLCLLSPLPGTEGTSVPPAPALPAAQEKSAYPDKLSGDDAYLAEDFPSAASFYRNYRKSAKDRKDTSALRDAFEREIDAWIRARVPKEAESTLNEYERAFSGANSLSVALWRANIRILQRRIQDAETILNALLPNLPKNDPRRTQALASVAFTKEFDKDFSGAAAIYEELAASEGDGVLMRRSVERGILMRTAAGELDLAMEKLKAMPLANDSIRDLRAMRLLSFFLQLKKEGAAVPPDLWQALVKDPPERREMFFYLVFSLAGEEFLKNNQIFSATEAFRLAYDTAPDRDGECTALSKLIESVSKAGNKADAARLALAQYRLFQGAKLPAAMKLRYCEILIAAEEYASILPIAQNLFEAENDINVRKSALQRIFRLLLDKKAYEPAKKMIDLFYRNDTKSPERDMFLAKILLAENRKKDAAELYKHAGASESFRIDAFSAAASVFFELKNYPEVIALCGEVLKQDSRNPVLFLRASALDKSGKIKEACADYLAYAALPDKTGERLLKAQSLFRTAELYLNSEKVKESIPLLQDVFRLYPETAFAPAAGYWLVHAFTLTGDNINAERETWLLAEHYPDSPFTYSASLRLASHYISSGSDDRAYAAVEAAAAQSKHPAVRARALYGKALIEFRRGDLDPARKTLHDLETLFPDDINLSAANYLRGDILRKQENFEDAAEAYLAAAKRRPGSPLEQAALGAAGDCYFAIAAKAEKPDLFDRALSQYRKVLEIPSLLPEYRAMAMYKSAKARQATGKEPDAAFDDFRKMLFLLPAQDAAARPAETFWIVKGLEALIEMAWNDPAGDHTDAAVKAVEWLDRASLIDSATANRRIKKIRQHKYRPIIQEIHKK